MRSKLNLWLAIVLLVLVPIIARGQDTTAKIHGHVQDPANAPIANGQVVLSKDGKTALFTFTTDANGDYKGEGIKPDTYYITLYATPGKAVDRFDNVKFATGTDTLQDFDLSRAEYVNKLPPEQRKALEEADGNIEAAIEVLRLKGAKDAGDADIQAAVALAPKIADRGKAFGLVP